MAVPTAMAALGGGDGGFDDDVDEGYGDGEDGDAASDGEVDGDYVEPQHDADYDVVA